MALMSAPCRPGICSLLPNAMKMCVAAHADWRVASWASGYANADADKAGTRRRVVKDNMIVYVNMGKTSVGERCQKRVGWDEER